MPGHCGVTWWWTRESTANSFARQKKQRSTEGIRSRIQGSERGGGGGLPGAPGCPRVPAGSPRGRVPGACRVPRVPAGCPYRCAPCIVPRVYMHPAPKCHQTLTLTPQRSLQAQTAFGPTEAWNVAPGTASVPKSSRRS